MKLNPEKVKQGVEVEGYLRTREQVETKIRALKEEKYYPRPSDTFKEEMLDLIGANNLWKAPHYDTGHSVEIDLKAFDNLGSFAEDLKTILSLVFEYSNKKDYLYMLLAENPITGYAGAHIHHSVPHSEDGKYYEIRKKLYPFQPFISLLGQNSSFKDEHITVQKHDPYESRSYAVHINYKVLGDRKDSRIMGDSGGFSEYVDGNGMLSPDDELGTLEVRYPSSSSLFQIVGMATFLKACLFQKSNKLQEREWDYPLRNLCSLVPKYGSLTPIKIQLPKFKSAVSLNIGQVFQMLLKSNSFNEGLKKALGELDTRDVSRVLKFFKIFPKGLSMTDYYNSALKDNEGIMTQCELIHKLGEKEFLKGEMIIDKINPISTQVEALEQVTPTDIPILDSRIFGITEQVKKLISPKEKDWREKIDKHPLKMRKRKLKKEKRLKIEESKTIYPPNYFYSVWDHSEGE